MIRCPECSGVGTLPSKLCDQSACGKPARFSYGWPGRGRMYGCEEHTQKALAVCAVFEAVGYSAADVRELVEVYEVEPYDMLADPITGKPFTP